MSKINLELSESCKKCDKYNKFCEGIEVVGGKLLQYCKTKTRNDLKPLSTKTPIKRRGKKDENKS